ETRTAGDGAGVDGRSSVALEPRIVAINERILSLRRSVSGPVLYLGKVANLLDGGGRPQIVHEPAATVALPEGGGARTVGARWYPTAQGAARPGRRAQQR